MAGQAIKPEDAEEYTQALGQVVAGGWRQIALGQRLGVPKALGLSVEEWVRQRLGGYVQLSLTEKKTAIAELQAEGLKQRDIAAIIGVNHSTVSRLGADAPTTERNVKKSGESGSSPGADAPTLSDRFDVLAEQQQRIEDIRRVRAEYPERFAVDEIFDALTYALDQYELWAGKAQLDSWSGTKDGAEWTALLNRLRAALEFARRVYESKAEAYTR